jgi:hypothetical protein
MGRSSTPRSYSSRPYQVLETRVSRVRRPQRPTPSVGPAGSAAGKPSVGDITRRHPHPAPERRAWLLERGAVGRLRPPVERLLADPGTLAAAARLLLDMHFTPVLAELICAQVDLDVPALDLAGRDRISGTIRLRPRCRGFAQEVLRAYAYQCAMCGFDGALGHYPVAIETAHVRWHSRVPEPKGETVITRYTLRELLDKLDALIRGQPLSPARRGWRGAGSTVRSDE